jgi:hypothetical protein
MNRSMSKTVSSVMFAVRRRQLIDKALIRLVSIKNPMMRGCAELDALEQAWDRGIAQGRKMQKKGL